MVDAVRERDVKGYGGRGRVVIPGLFNYPQIHPNAFYKLNLQRLTWQIAGYYWSYTLLGRLV